MGLTREGYIQLTFIATAKNRQREIISQEGRLVKKVNRLFFSNWNPDMAYVFGFWFADGWMSQPDKDPCITFTSADLEHLQIIQYLMESEHKIYSRVGKCYDLTLGSKQLWHDLYHLGRNPLKEGPSPP